MTPDDATVSPNLPAWDIRDVANAPVPELAADDRALAGAATHRVFEFEDCWVAAPGAVRVLAGDEVLKAAPNGWWRLRYENRVGVSTLRALDADGRDCLPPLTLLVLTRKLPTVGLHVGFLGTLLDDLFARSARLPFVVAAPTAQQARETGRPPDAIFAYHLLCAEAAAIAAGARVIAALPHRRLEGIDAEEPVHRARRLDAAGLLAAARAPELAVLRGVAHPATLVGRPPTPIPHRRSEETRDTPENRFAIHVLRALRDTALRLRRERWWSSVPDDRRVLLAGLAGAIDATLREPWVRGIGPMTRLPGASRVLQRVEGYRDLARIWSLMQQARRPLFDGVSRAIAMLDVATLYELWVFFRVAADLGAAFGATPVLKPGESAGFGLPRDTTARIAGHGELIYNAGKRGYAQRMLRPDLLWVPADRAAGQVALDAKFRLDRPLAEDDASSDAAFRNDDIVKMHAYRDALPIRAAAIVYPGDMTAFWTPDGARTSPGVADLIAGDRSGVGAIACRPSAAILPNEGEAP